MLAADGPCAVVADGEETGGHFVKKLLRAPFDVSVAIGVGVTDGGAGDVVREVFVIHVGGTRCATSNTDHILNRQARVTWTVACIRTCSFYVFIVCVKTRTSMIQTHLFFSMLLMFRYPADVVATALARGAQPVANASLEQRVRK